MHLGEATDRRGSRLVHDQKPIVYIVDDDESIRVSLEWLIRRAGWQPIAFASAAEFLAYRRCPKPSCLLLDITLPDLSGLDVQELLAGQGEVPIIFITGYGDVPTTVRAMKAGALEFLVKPFQDDVLLSAIPRAFEISASALRDQSQLEAIHSRYAALTPRERDVMNGVVSGRLSKQLAHDLGISENTIKVHRFNMMRKMHAASVMDLVNMASKLRIVPVQ